MVRQSFEWLDFTKKRFEIYQMYKDIFFRFVMH